MWFAGSPYLEIGEAILPNNIAYYVEGDEHVARTLKLVANFNNQDAAIETRTRFAGLADRLIRQALDQETPEVVRSAILSEMQVNLPIGKKTIQLVRESWPTGRGYQMRFYIQT